MGQEKGGKKLNFLVVCRMSVLFQYIHDMVSMCQLFIVMMRDACVCVCDHDGQYIPKQDEVVVNRHLITLFVEFNCEDILYRNDSCVAFMIVQINTRPFCTSQMDKNRLH